METIKFFLDMCVNDTVFLCIIVALTLFIGYCLGYIICSSSFRKDNERIFGFLLRRCNIESIFNQIDKDSKLDLAKKIEFKSFILKLKGKNFNVDEYYKRKAEAEKLI